jgi:transposase InsO family protein
VNESIEASTKKELAAKLGISRGTLYYHHKIPEKDEKLRVAIESVMLKHPGYGYRRVADDLKINKKRAKRVMKKYGLRPARRARTPNKPCDKNKTAVGYPDCTRLFAPIAPNIVWVSDFTFISYKGRFIYLCTILDLFTGEVLGSNIMTSHSSELVSVAVKRAIASQGICPVWFHSDQGSEYDSFAVARWLEKQGVQISMSPKASPWRNGAQESFYGRFKIEFGDPDRFETLEQLIEALYYQLHYHSTLRIKNKLRMSPSAFRRKWESLNLTSKPSAQVVNTSQQLISLPPDPPQGGNCYIFGSV